MILLATLSRYTASAAPTPSPPPTLDPIPLNHTNLTSPALTPPTATTFAIHGTCRFDLIVQQWCSVGRSTLLTNWGKLAAIYNPRGDADWLLPSHARNIMDFENNVTGQDQAFRISLPMLAEVLVVGPVTHRGLDMTVNFQYGT